ncbi:MAG: T9SS type A sorting domain-containing protein [Lacibacter sp.]|nr:T9SS type A sorting domain-containing protein [Lacibacter sp.]
MKNKVQVSFRLKKEFLLFLLIIGCLLPAAIEVQCQSSDGSKPKLITKSGELKVKQQGSNWQFLFPRIQFRAALKVMNSNGAVVKAVMIDEGLEFINISLNNLPKGIYQCVLENRTQRFTARVMVR